MRKVRLFDQNFKHAKDPSTFDGLNVGEHPFQWSREDLLEKGPVFYTDQETIGAKLKPYTTNVAMLIEPYEINPNVYKYTIDNRHSFWCVLTHEEDFVERCMALPYVPIQYHVEDLTKMPKTKLVSMIGSSKNTTTGHKFRQKVMKRGGIFDLYGRGTRPIDKKEEGLQEYCFSIAIENTQGRYNITEKLLDCFLTRTIPIYWGGSEANDMFDSKGILSFRTLEELDNILDNLSFELYHSLIDSVEENFNRCINKYPSLERYLWDRYETTIFREI